MNSRFDTKTLKIIALLIFLVILLLILILFLNLIRIDEIPDDVLKSIVGDTNWPIDDVPIMAKDGIVVEDMGEYSTMASISHGVTYVDLKKYLIELHDAGFKADENNGSLNPKYMISSLEGTGINEIMWMGDTSDYYISVMWAAENAIDEFGNKYPYNLEIYLTSKNQNDLKDSEDLNMYSGDIDIQNNENKNLDGNINISNNNLSDDINILDYGNDNLSGEIFMSGEVVNEET